MYVFHGKSVKRCEGKSASISPRKSANWGFLTQVLTAVEWGIDRYVQFPVLLYCQQHRELYLSKAVTWQPSDDPQWCCRLFGTTAVPPTWCTMESAEIRFCHDSFISWSQYTNVTDAPQSCAVALSRQSRDIHQLNPSVADAPQSCTVALSRQSRYIHQLIPGSFCFSIYQLIPVYLYPCSCVWAVTWHPSADPYIPVLQMTPSHVLVQQCRGGCTQLEPSCLPSRTRTRRIPVVLGKCGITQGQTSIWFLKTQL
jgi:hypothetical protein